MPIAIQSVLPSAVRRSVRYVLSRSLLCSTVSPSDQLNPRVLLPDIDQTDNPSDTDDTTSTPAHVAVGGSPQSITTISHLNVPLGLQNITPDRDTCGVDWVIAGVGVQLWLHARARAETTPDFALLRSMHLDALKYMNMALPTDLSPSEITMLQSGLPWQLKQQREDSNHVVVATTPNILRRTVAQTVYWTIAILLMLVPHFITMFNQLLKYEREHHIARRALHNGTNAIKAVGERSLDLGDAIIQCKDTKLGKASLNVSAWMLESVAGGLNDGLSRGMGSEAKLLES